MGSATMLPFVTLSFAKFGDYWTLENHRGLTLHLAGHRRMTHADYWRAKRRRMTLDGGNSVELQRRVSRRAQRDVGCC